MGAGALEAARKLAAGIDPALAARAIGGTWSGDETGGTIGVRFLGDGYRISWPGLELSEDSPQLPEHVVALLVYHLALSDGAMPTGRAVSFAELPDGSFYVTAFRGYTGNAIARRFGSDPDALARSAAALEGRAVESASDAAWLVPALPRVPVTLQWWDGDDEFEPRAELLFDETASHHLTTDGCAVLGSWLTASLARVAG